jgi:hypothetical protein
VEVLSLCVGEPDFSPAEHILEATKDAVNQGVTRYTQVEGTVELRQAICDDLKKRKGLDYVPEEVLIEHTLIILSSYSHHTLIILLSYSHHTLIILLSYSHHRCSSPMVPSNRCTSRCCQCALLVTRCV